MKISLRLLILFCTLLAGQAMAATCTAKTGSQDWDDKDSWTGCDNKPPQKGDTVIIPNGSTVTLDKDTKDIASLAVASGGVLLGDNDNNKLNLTAPGDLTNNGTITLSTAEIDMEGDFVNTGTFNAGSDNIKIEGNLSNSGTFNPQTSEVEFSGNGVQTVSGNVTFNDLTVDNGSTNGLLLNGNVIVTGSLSGNAVSGGLVKLSDTCPINYTLTSNSGATVQNSCPPAPGPIADYRFDEAAWNGSTGEVKDSSVSKVDGKAFGGATTVSGKVCKAGTFDGKSKYLSVTGLSNLLSGTATLSFWINTTQTGNNSSYVAPGVSGIEHRGGADDVFWGWINANGKIAVSKGNTLGAQSSSNINSGTWRHIVLTRVQSTGVTKAYVDGVLQATRTSEKGMVTRSFSSIGRIENSYINSAAPFDLDEVKVFSAVLSDAQVSDIYANENAGKNWDGSARACSVTAPHHLAIESSGTGLTCAASTLTVRACADATCATPYTGGVSGAFTAVGTPTVNWDGASGGASGAGFVIPSGSSSVTKNVQVATAGSVVFGATASTPAATNTTTCNFGSPSCTFTVNTAGFIFSNSTTGTGYTIPAQISGSATGTLYLRALQTSSTNAAVCTPAIISQSNVAVNLNYNCNNPATCQTGSLASINSTPVASSATSVNLNFDANASAPIAVRYDDVGQITLAASKTITPPGGTAVTLNGTSNAFVVAPHHFGFSNVTASPIKAGNNFAATVTAYNGLGTPTATRNFGKETTPEGVSLSFTKCEPTGTGTANGSFSGAVGGFNAGIASASNLNWSEVGNGDLSATLASGSYLDSGLSASGNTGTGGTVCSGAGNVGRFTPDYLDTAIVAGTAPIPCPAGLTCPSNTPGAVGMAYSSQPIVIQVAAKNASGGTTVNYQGSFAKANTLSAWSAAGSAGTANPGGGTLSNTALAATAFSAGVGTTPVSTPNITRPTYALATLTTAPTNVYFRAVDTDGITSLRTNPVEAGLKVASGRIRIPNAYGSELLALPLTVTVQYYNGSTWLTSLTDNVTSFDSNLSPSGNLVASIITGLAGGISVSNPGVTTVAAGISTISLAAPGVAGSANISLNAPSYLPSAPARATFGIYKSSLIYRRENY